MNRTRTSSLSYYKSFEKETLTKKDIAIMVGIAVYITIYLIYFNY